MAANVTPKAATTRHCRAVQPRGTLRHQAARIRPENATRSQATPAGARRSNSTTARAAPTYCDTAPTTKKAGAGTRDQAGTSPTGDDGTGSGAASPTPTVELGQ